MIESTCLVLYNLPSEEVIIEQKPEDSPTSVDGDLVLVVVGAFSSSMLDGTVSSAGDAIKKNYITHTMKNILYTHYIWSD